MNEVIVRFPPSPTGPFHIGNARTALFNYLFAKSQNGKMILRFEDTDLERSEKKWEEEILRSLKWLGISWDGEIVRQSERKEVYKKHLENILESGKAYRCFCTKEDLEKEKEIQNQKKLPPGYSGKCRNVSKEESDARAKRGEGFIIRFRVPEKTLSYKDLVHGEISEDGSKIKDFAISRGPDKVLYNFANVIDDHDMGVTHVIRGEDHVSNTFKQIFVYEALGWNLPSFGHLPLLVSTDKKKISKRNSEGLPVTTQAFREKGVLPEAAVNFLALLGWNPGTEEEFFTLKELEKRFSIERVGKSASVYDISRLEFFNSSYIRKLSDGDFADKLKSFLEGEEIPENFIFLAKTIKERIRFLSEAKGLLKWFFHWEVPSKELLLNEKMKVDENMAKKALSESLKLLKSLDDYSEYNLKEKFIDLVKKLELKNGQVLWPARAALTGEKFSPGAFEVASVLGKEKSIFRLEKALESF